LTNNNDIKHYSAEDISRYWQGKLSAQEMHALERAAMDDPFLADALEGYGNQQPEETNEAILDLQKRLQTRTTGKVAPMPSRTKWWRVAAALILLCGAGVLSYTLLIQPGASRQTVAQQEEKLQPAANVTSDSTEKITSAQTPAAETTSHNQPANPAIEQSRSTQTSQKTSSADVATKQTTNAAGVEEKLKAFRRDENDTVFIAQSERSDPRAFSRSATPPPVQNNQTSNPAEYDQSNAMRGQLSFNNFSGRVIDPNNNAIPFASVRSNNAQVASTNADGYFQLRSSDTVLDLSINSAGFVPRQLTLRGNTATPDVVLEPQQNGKLKEVVVTGYGQGKKAAAKNGSDLKVYTMDAEPVNGWNAYNAYIEQNKRIEPSYEAIKGEVTVSFTVGKRGQLSNFTIEKSLSKKQDEEAIRLVKEGPAWKLLKGKKTTARVIVPF